MMERQRVACCALLTVRGNNSHLSERLDSLHETLESVREDPIIVCAKQTHQFSPALTVRGLYFLKTPERCAHKVPITRIASRNSRK